MSSTTIIKRRSSNDDNPNTGKRSKVANTTKLEGSARPKTSKTLLEKMRRAVCGNFTYKEGVIAGPCIVCSEEMSLSWYDWKQHLLEHTDENQFYCFECNVQLFDKSEHTECPPDTVIDVFGHQDVGCALEGFICQLCDHFQINDYRLMDHLEKEHNGLGASFETHAARVCVVPDVRPEGHNMKMPYAYVSQKERYRCGVGKCIFHANNLAEYADHFQKAHRILKTYFCPHCNLLMNRAAQSTVEHERIMQHIECHGRVLHQCVACDFVTTSEVEIRTHIADEHTEMSIKFWRNKRGDGGADSEVIEILLDCGLCGERVQNIRAAHDHFKEAHQGLAINFKAVQLIKTTTKELEVTRSMDDSYLRYIEVLLCGACDDSHFTNKHDWFKHFSQIHPTNALAMKRSFKWTTESAAVSATNFEFDRHMLFYCKSCENTNDGKSACSSQIEDIYDHWIQRHKNDDVIPFQFYMAEIVACNYCDVMSTFQGVKEHAAKVHPDRKFTPIKAFVDGKLCAFCNASFAADLAEHVTSEHSLAIEADVLNPIPLDEPDLMLLLHIEIQKKLKCGYCNKIFDSRQDYRIHHTTEHQKLERSAHSVFDKDSIVLIGDCCHEPIDPNTFYDHLEYHKYSLKCEKCTFRATDPFHLMRHKVDAHDATETVSELYCKFLRLRYWRSELQFGNGLVLNKFNTQGIAEYDYTAQFEHFVDRLVTEKMKEFEGKPIISQ